MEPARPRRRLVAAKTIEVIWGIDDAPMDNTIRHLRRMVQSEANMLFLHVDRTALALGMALGMVLGEIDTAHFNSTMYAPVKAHYEALEAHIKRFCDAAEGSQEAKDSIVCCSKDCEGLLDAINNLVHESGMYRSWVDLRKKYINMHGMCKRFQGCIERIYWQIDHIKDRITVA
jgi:hypothetical protein